MIILAIETSCDETAISVIEGSGEKNPTFKTLAHFVSSQVELHAQWGGVVPNLARREHVKNFTPLLIEALTEAKLLKPASGRSQTSTKIDKEEEIKKILEREPELFDDFIKLFTTVEIPKIDAIAVTNGPGLEPALWVGVNAAKALATAWGKPLVPVNHMAGHIYSVLATNVRSETSHKIQFPALALLVSGGHTELVEIKDWLNHKVIGQTRDDAVGEAFDKVARLLDLPYPGGPEISKLALLSRTVLDSKLPRPMIHSDDLDFSFSGLKTAVLYLVKKLKENGEWNDEIRAAIAHEFQTAAVEVLVAKTLKAIEQTGAKTLIVGGGVVANTELRKVLTDKATSKFPDINLLLSDTTLATDNATMIAIAGYLSLAHNQKLPPLSEIKAKGNLSL